MRQSVGVVLGMAAGLAFALSCESADNPVAPGGHPEAVTIELTPGDSLFAVGATQAFRATARDLNGNPMPGISFTWRSDGPTVATVDGAGVATSVGDGKATITVSGAGVTASTVLTVSPTITNVARVSAVDQPELDVSNDAAAAALTVTIRK